LVAGRVAVCLLASFLWSLPAVHAQVPVPAPGAPTVIPEKREAPLPAPGGPGAAPVPPGPETPEPEHRFTGTDHLDPNEISAEALIGQPVLAPDGRSLGLVVDLMLQDGQASSLKVRPAGADPQGEATTIAIDRIRMAPDRRALTAADEEAIGEPDALPVMTDIDRVGQILNADIATQDGALAGQIHDLIMDDHFKVKDVVVRLAGMDTQRDVLISVPYRWVERPPGTEIHLIDNRVRDGLVEFSYEPAP
jgi:sporulation protein YlmC with PRC-barrel domain